MQKILLRCFVKGNWKDVRRETFELRNENCLPITSLLSSMDYRIEQGDFILMPLMY